MNTLSRIIRRQPDRCRATCTAISTTSRSIERNLRYIDRRLLFAAAALAIFAAVPIAKGGEATTSASAGSNGIGPGTASATANYTGQGQGFARTRTHSGRVNYGRGVAFGIDRNGVNFSASTAIAPMFGPAVASNFNLSVGFNGEVSGSRGVSVAGGSRTRSVSAGGSTQIRRGRPSSISRASGRTARRGFVRALTRSRSNHRRPPWRL